MDFPIQDVMDESACYEKLKGLLHPDGLACPRCHKQDGVGVHRYRREHTPDYRCSKCGRVFNIYTGTKLEGTRRQPSELVLILRGIVQGTPTAKLAREVGCSRWRLLEFRHRVQEWAQAALPTTPLADPVTEADEMFQNAVEKRHSAQGTRRSATTTGQQKTRSRHVGQRPSRRGRDGRSRIGTRALASSKAHHH